MMKVALVVLTSLLVILSGRKTFNILSEKEKYVII